VVLRLMIVKRPSFAVRTRLYCTGALAKLELFWLGLWSYRRRAIVLDNSALVGAPASPNKPLLSKMQPLKEFVVSDTLPAVRKFLDAVASDYEVLACDPSLADTREFCEHYQIPVANSANAILVKSRKGDPTYTLCVLLATHRLDVNHSVRKKMAVKKVSFASADETRELTGMEIGGVTPIGLPESLPIWVDEAVMQCEFIILGGGNRSSKLKLAPDVFTHVPNAEVVSGLANLIEPK